VTASGDSGAASFERTLLDAIARAHARFFQTDDPRIAFGELLEVLLEITASEYGFIGEVLYERPEQPYLKIHAITDISWDESSRAFFAANAPSGLEFRNLKSLFGAVMTERQPVIANEPASDPRSGGLPPGHPALDHFMGLPYFSGPDLIGMLGVANRPGGYDGALARALDPLLATCANLVSGHRARRERMHSVSQLRRSEESLRMALAAGKLGAWDWDIESDQIVWSDETLRIFGLPPGGYPAALDGFVGLVHPEDRDAVIGEIRRALDGGDSDEFRAEHRIELPSGEVRWLAAIGRVTRDADGKPVRLLGTVKDITEDKRLAARLMQADRMVAVGTLAAGVGHEINNPLAYVAGNLRLMAPRLEALARQGAQPGDRRLTELRAMVDDATTGADRIAEIVRQLRTFSRSDDVARPVDLAAVVRSAVAMAGSHIHHRAELRIELPALPLVFGQVGPLSQVLLNLLVNAAQAIEPGAVERNRIEVTGRAAERHVVLEVADTGGGIPPDVLPHIFDPFFTTKSVGEGTGLGLAVSRQIVSDHGGELRVTSSPGRGTRVEVVLPIGQPAGELAAAPAGPVAVPAVNVLVVDDEPAVGRLIARLLEPDATAVVATSASEARQALATTGFDVILCDLLMPGETGMALYDRVCRDRPELTGRFVFMTGGAFTVEARDFLARVGPTVVDKPIDPEALIEVVRRIAGDGARAARRSPT
jgi:two-component system, NtrC family, sensor kinase